MSGGRCWSSIVATQSERAALELGHEDEWLVGCVLREGHPGAHASDGHQIHHGRRRWLVWGDFARGTQALRDEDPCPVQELDGAHCLFYFGHSGQHRYPGIGVDDAQPPTGSLMNRRPQGATPQPQVPAPEQTPGRAASQPDPQGHGQQWDQSQWNQPQWDQPQWSQSKWGQSQRDVSPGRDELPWQESAGYQAQDHQAQGHHAQGSQPQAYQMPGNPAQAAGQPGWQQTRAPREESPSAPTARHVLPISDWYNQAQQSNDASATEFPFAAGSPDHDGRPIPPPSHYGVPPEPVHSEPVFDGQSPPPAPWPTRHRDDAYQPRPFAVPEQSDVSAEGTPPPLPPQQSPARQFPPEPSATPPPLPSQQVRDQQSEYRPDAMSALDRLFADLPSLKPQGASATSPRPDAADPVLTGGEWLSFDFGAISAQAHRYPPVEADDFVDVEPVDAESLDGDQADVEQAGGGRHGVDAWAEIDDARVVATYAEPRNTEVPLPPLPTGPARFEPAALKEPAAKQDHEGERVTNDYVPSLGDDTPGGSTSVVFRDDPSATSMEVRPTSTDVLTTSMLQVITSSNDPTRMGVPVTLKPLGGIGRDVPLEELSGEDLKAMTAAVHDAADRLRANPGSGDTSAIGEALRDVALSLSQLADRLGE
ncbi:hypothetical protein [Gordonia zhaorongruii]|uniref:hypothetical protein n=1 Tax=Gordonia zhaorongruii TaxID=2597659 RepID=UPI00117D191A|nr:hypothetical protein [Gordonia zhaorongruii]